MQTKLHYIYKDDSLQHNMRSGGLSLPIGLGGNGIRRADDMYAILMTIDDLRRGSTKLRKAKFMRFKHV